MTSAQVVEAREEHIVAMSWNMRDADRREVWASTHLTPGDALIASVQPDVCEWSESYAAFIDSQLVAMFGVVCVRIDEGVGAIGVPWMLGADSLTKYPLTMMKTSRKWLASFQERYDYLGNFVDARYKGAVHWIEALGFTVFEAAPFGPDDALFHQFEWRRAD